MLISNQFFHAFAILAIAAVGATAHADCIQINSFPYTVYESGFYCLTSDFSVNSDLYKQDTITVSASNVDIDFQGHKITNTAVSANRLAGVRISNLTALHDVNIHNGALSWFDDGILAESVQPNANNGYSNTQPSNLTVDGMTVSYTKTSGINLFGMNLRVTNNSISSVSGSTVAYGIKLWSGLPGPVDMTASNRAVVQNNYVAAVKLSETGTF